MENNPETKIFPLRPKEKQGYKWTKIGIIAALLVFTGTGYWFAQAEDANVDDLAAKKSENQKKLDALNKQITQYTNQIVQTQAQAQSLQNEIIIYDAEIASTELAIQAKETQIEDTLLQINALEKLIAQKEQDIENSKKLLASMLVELNQYDQEYFLKTTLSADNFSEFLDQVQYTQAFQDKIFQLLQKIKELKTQMEAQQAELKIQLGQLEELKHQLEITRQSLNETRSQKQQLLTQTKGLEKNYQKLLGQSKAAEADVQKEIDDLDNQIRARLGNKSIPAAKGVLGWPMDGVLTQGYGKTGFTSLGYNSHNGIDVAAPAGSPVYAAADGEVVGTDMSNQAYGNWVAIKHNISTKKGSDQIVTLYGHMRSFKVKVGQKVKQGDIIGYEGNTGNTTAKLYGPERGYHVHFGVYDAEGFGITKSTLGNYYLPYGYTYDPRDFLN